MEGDAGACRDDNQKAKIHTCTDQTSPGYFLSRRGPLSSTCASRIPPAAPSRIFRLAFFSPSSIVPCASARRRVPAGKAHLISESKRG